MDALVTPDGGKVFGDLLKTKGVVAVGRVDVGLARSELYLDLFAMGFTLPLPPPNFGPQVPGMEREVTRTI